MGFSWFRDNSQQLRESQPPVTTKPFYENMEEWIDELDWTERKFSSTVSPHVYSRLRIINDLFRNLIPFIEKYNIRAEEEYIIKSTLNNYIPEALSIFERLSKEDRTRNNEQLLQQFFNIEKNVRQLIDSMEQRVESELSAHTAFVEERFSHQI